MVRLSVTEATPLSPLHWEVGVASERGASSEVLPLLMMFNDVQIAGPAIGFLRGWIQKKRLQVE